MCVYTTYCGKASSKSLTFARKTSTPGLWGPRVSSMGDVPAMFDYRMVTVEATSQRSSKIV